MPIDFDKPQKLEDQLTDKITKLIISQERTDESPIASITALSNVLCMLSRVMFGPDKAPQAISDCINRSLQCLALKDKQKKS